jgi:hypothetical protein
MCKRPAGPAGLFVLAAVIALSLLASLAGSPSPARADGLYRAEDLFAKFKPESGFHFLPVRYSANLQDYYAPTELTDKDYPNLLQPGESIETIGVPQVLAVYNWPADNERYRRVARFVKYLFDRFDQFKKPPFHPKWNEINLASTLPGWTRFRAAEELLAERRQSDSDSAIKQQFGAWIKNNVETSGRQFSSEEAKNLFEQFRSWMKQGRNPAGSRRIGRECPTRFCTRSLLKSNNRSRSAAAAAAPPWIGASSSGSTRRPPRFSIRRNLALAN